MAELVGIYAASHGLLIVRNWDVLPAATQAPLTAAFGELGRRINAVRPNVLIVISPDHGFCIPLWKANLNPLPAIVPVIINTVEPPLPSPARCLDLGRSMADAALT